MITIQEIAERLDDNDLVIITTGGEVSIVAKFKELTADEMGRILGRVQGAIKNKADAIEQMLLGQGGVEVQDEFLKGYMEGVLEESTRGKNVKITDLGEEPKKPFDGTRLEGFADSD